MLAVIATCSFVYAAIFVFDVDPAEIGGYFLWSVVGLLILAFAALIFVFVLNFIKRIVKR